MVLVNSPTSSYQRNKRRSLEFPVYKVSSYKTMWWRVKRFVGLKKKTSGKSKSNGKQRIRHWDDSSTAFQKNESQEDTLSYHWETFVLRHHQSSAQTCCSAGRANECKENADQVQIHKLYTKHESTMTTRLKRLSSEGVNTGGKLFRTLASRLLFILKEEESAMKKLDEAVENGLIPRCELEEKLLAQVFVEQVNILLPNLHPELVAQIKEKCETWFGEGFFNVLPEAVAYSVIDLLLVDGMVVFFQTGFALVQAVQAAIDESKAVASSCLNEKELRNYKFDSKDLFNSARSFPIDNKIIQKAIVNTVTTKLSKDFDIAQLKEFEFVGFDLDHTLVEYFNTEELLFKVALRTLLDSREFTDLREVVGSAENYSYHLVCPAKGAVIDTVLGNVLLLDKGSDIAMAYHGSTKLTIKQISAIYTDGQIDQNHSRYLTMSTDHESPFMAVLTVIADAIKDKPLSENFDWPKLCLKLKKSFVFIHSQHCDYGLENSLSENVGNYVKKSKHTLRFLTYLQSLGCKLFILTNASEEHADRLMTYAYGKGWKAKFEYIVYRARKQSFFDISAEPVDSQMEQALRETGSATGGSFKEFNRLLSGKVLFFGDHLHQDVVSPYQVGWSTVAIVSKQDDVSTNPLLVNGRYETRVCQLVDKFSISCTNSLNRFSSALLKRTLIRFSTSMK